jgi:hypothetical protein
MIAAGYMAKNVTSRPEWLEPKSVELLLSVSGCISKDFADYIEYWKHNGYWFFDSIEGICEVADLAGVSLHGTTLLYYEVYEHEFDQNLKTWSPFLPESSFTTNVQPPVERLLCGYDVVTFFAGTSPECSPLSCNSLALNESVNRNCLYPTFELARDAVDNLVFADSEPGPIRIFAVYCVPAGWPN